MDDTNRHANLDRGKLRRPQPQTKNYRQMRNAESRRKVLPREEHTNLVK